MALEGLSARAGLTTRFGLTPWWLRVVIVFVASRIVTTSILLYYASIQLKNPWTEASPGYFDFARIWDAHWYYIISVVGYPTVLPVTNDGHIGESAWAFMPAYPALVKLFTATGLDFAVVAVVVSVGFALGTALLLYRLMARFLEPGTALFSVVLFCFAPLSPILQVGYAESMHTFLLTLALYLLITRRYWLLLPVVGVMALTRPSGLAFALALALHVGWRLWHRRSDPFPVREGVGAATATLFSGFMGVSWLLIAWGVTGSPTAYTDTELAWRAGYIGYTELVPFTSWISGAEFWLRFPFGWGVVIAGVAFIVGFIGLVLSPLGRRLGPDIQFWLLSYLAYVLAVFFPQSSTFRLLVPLFPALGAVAVPRHPAYRIALVLLFIAGQVVWVQFAWYVDGSDWTPP
jgi:hypothetical protein